MQRWGSLIYFIIQVRGLDSREILASLFEIEYCSDTDMNARLAIMRRPALAIEKFCLIEDSRTRDYPARQHVFYSTFCLYQLWYLIA